MKGRLRKLVLFVLLGAVVNIAVAWFVAVTIELPVPLSPGWKLIGERIDGDVGSFALTRFSRVGTLGLFSYRIQRKVTGLTNLSLSEEPKVIRRGSDPADSMPAWLMEFDSACSEMKSGSTRGEFRLAIARGWPFLSVWGEHQHLHLLLFDRPADNKPLRGRLITSLPPWRNGLPRAVEFLPIWPGFAINTIFYAAILWLLTLGRFTAHRIIRHKRGRCVKCGYNLRGTAQMICSECGYEVRAEAGT